MKFKHIISVIFDNFLLGPIGWLFVGLKKSRNPIRDDESSSVDGTPAGPDDWFFQAKPIPRWKMIIGEGLFRSRVLDFVKYSKGNLTVKVANGKSLSLPFVDAECKYQYSLGQDAEDSVSTWVISVRSKGEPNESIKFEADQAQMPLKWWESLRDKLGASEHISATQKFSRATAKGLKAAVKGVVDLFKTPCPECGNKDENTRNEISRTFLGQVQEAEIDLSFGTDLERNRRPKKYNTYFVYDVSYQWVCGRCSCEWKSSARDKERA